MTRLFPTLALVVGAFTALPAAAQWAKPEDAAKYRQSAMALQGNHLGRVFAMANGQVPFDAKVAADQIDIVATLNRLQFAAFIDGSDKVAGSRAKPEIWTEKGKFNAAVAKSQESVAALVVAGRSGNIDQIKTAAGAVGAGCKNCHDTFQAPAR